MKPSPQTAGTKKKRRLWSKGYETALVIGIDDVHPEQRGDGTDFGLDLEKGSLGLIAELVEEFPSLQVTLFVTPDWRLRLGSFDSFVRWIQRLSLRIRADKLVTRLLVKPYPSGRFRLDQERIKGWCKSIGRRISRGEFSVGMHGLSHFNPWLNFANEFAGLSYEECISRIRIAKEIFRKAKIKSVKGFAPPGWTITGNLITALLKEGFEYIAGAEDHLSPVDPLMYCNESGMYVPLFYPRILHGGLVSIPRNWDMRWSGLDRAEEILKINGIIGVHGHVAKTPGVINEISESTITNLRQLLEYLEEKHSDEIWFTNFNEVAQYLRENFGESDILGQKEQSSWSSRRRIY